MKKYEQSGVAMTCRGMEEYRRMFALTDGLLAAGEILDVAAGASSFVADATRSGYRAVAADPRYGLPPGEWLAEAAGEIGVSSRKIAALADIYDWSFYGDPAHHRLMREASLARFAEDIASPDAQERYVPGALPELPFASDRFDLVLCSHFLFLYGEQFGEHFHERSLLELLRVCKPGGEIRIYPLVDLTWKPYPGLDGLIERIVRQGASAERLPSQLPFIPHSDRLLRIVKDGVHDSHCILTEETL